MFIKESLQEFNERFDVLNGELMELVGLVRDYKPEVSNFLESQLLAYQEKIIKEVEVEKRNNARLSGDKFERDNYFYNLGLTDILNKIKTI